MISTVAVKVIDFVLGILQLVIVALAAIGAFTVTRFVRVQFGEPEVIEQVVKPAIDADGKFIFDDVKPTMGRD